LKDFKLHPNLASKHLLFDLPLCHVFLENSAHFPWLIMVPRYPNASRIMDLPHKEQLMLLLELDQMQKLLWNEFHPTQINVAAIGNKTPQLHIHVIARFENDPAWPNTVWDYPNEAKSPSLDYIKRLNSTIRRS
jgi:diadenosine tetraphosphate (Ap4A) HIT family hydrolase